ncbi:MAG: IS66 family transposase zinc-finger binding domain-containing protein [Burkholderia sp.]
MRGERDELRGELHVTKVERDSRQGDLFLNESERLAPMAATRPAQEDRAEIEVAGHKHKQGGRKPLDPALPREVIRYEMPVDQLVCSADGSKLVEIGVEVSEQLDIIPQQIRVIRHERVQYACEICDHGLKVAPVPPRIIPKGRFTKAALA